MLWLLTVLTCNTYGAIACAQRSQESVENGARATLLNLLYIQVTFIAVNFTLKIFIYPVYYIEVIEAKRISDDAFKRAEVAASSQDSRDKEVPSGETN